jgi:hypothetical protein
MGNLFLCSCTKCATPGEAPRGSTTNVQFSFSWWLRSFARPTALDRVSKSALTCVNTTPRFFDHPPVLPPGTDQSFGVGGSWKSEETTTSSSSAVASW